MTITKSDQLNAEIKELRKKEGIFAAIELKKKQEELRVMREKHLQQIESVRPMISRFAKRFSVATDRPFKEMEQAAICGALRAAETFDEKFGCKFITHANSHVRQAMVVWFGQMYVPNGYRHRRDPNGIPVSVAHMSSESTNGVSYFEAAIDERTKNPEEEAISNIDNAAMVDKVKKLLTEKEFDILWLALGMGHERKVIAKMLGISRERIKQILTDCVAKIRAAMPEDVEGVNQFDKLIATRTEWKSRHKKWRQSPEGKLHFRQRYHKKKVNCLSGQATLF